MCSSHVLFLGSTNLPRCWVRDGMEGGGLCMSACPLVMPAEFSKHSFMFIWHTLGIEGLGLGPVLGLRQYPRNAGLTGKNVVIDVQLPVNLTH